MLFDHFFVPGIFEPHEVVPLSRRETRFDFRQAVKHGAATFSSLGSPCGVAACAEFIHSESFEMMPRFTHAFRVLNLAFRLPEMCECVVFGLNCSLGITFERATALSELLLPQNTLVFGVAQPRERLRDCGRLLAYFPFFPSLWTALAA